MIRIPNSRINIDRNQLPDTDVIHIEALVDLLAA